MWIIFLILFILVGLYFLFRFRDKVVVLNCFKLGNVCVTGLRGRGKDSLFSFVINSRKRLKYVSNCDYSGDNRFIKYDYSLLSVGGNSHLNFIMNKVHQFECPIPEGADVFLSDCGVYFPSYDNSYLNKNFPSLPIAMSLSRHLWNGNVHSNAQNLNRIWDKIREQSDTYIQCTRCRNFFGYAQIKGYIYDNADSCIARRKPMKRRWGKAAKIEYDKFTAAYGSITPFNIIFRRSYRYDDRLFKTLTDPLWSKNKGGLNEKHKRK